MKARLRVLPFDNTWAEHDITEICTITELLQKLEADDEFYTNGKILIDDHEIYKDKWGKIKVRPEPQGFVDIVLVPNNKSTAVLIASVALAVAVTFISAGALGPAGLGLLGATFGAGGLGASLAAAGVGLAGAYVLGQLTGLPPAAQEQSRKDLSQAGIGGNAASPDSLLPVIFGRIGYSPPQIIPAYTTFDDDELTVHAILGVEGRCAISGIKVNGTDIAEMESITWETREGAPGDLPLTLAQLTCIQQTGAVTLSTFKLQGESTYDDVLVDQADPAKSSPAYHNFVTDGSVDEIWIRLLFPAGIVDALSDSNAFVPIRIEARKVGDVAWRNFPTIHVQDLRHGSGSLRVEVKIKFQTQASGRHFSNAYPEYPIFELTNITMIGQTPEYQSDAYFQNSSWPPTSQIPVMTAATTSGVTMSASSELAAGQAAWKAADNNDATTGWQPSNNTLPGAWIKVDFGAAKTIRSYFLASAAASSVAPTNAPLTWYVEGSNDDTNWTRLDDDDVDVSSFPLAVGYYQIGTPGSYRYYRWTVLTNNGAANEQIFISHIAPFLVDAVGTVIYNDTTAFPGNPTLHNSGGKPRSIYGSLSKNGATFYLDPAQWLPGPYEVRLKRGRSNDTNAFDPIAYRIGGGLTSSDFFEHFISGGKEVIRYGQKDIRSDVQVEVFSSVSYDVPVDTLGIACIGLSIKNTTVRSVYAIFESYGNEYDGSVWEEIQGPTRRPAALYRNVLLGYGNADPAPGEVIEIDVFEDWFANNVSADHECNMVISGQVLRDVLQIIATAGMAAPRNSNELGIVEDLDTSAEPPRNPLTPANSRNLGTQIILPTLPHGVRLEFFNEDDDYSVDNTITIYRDGYNATNAKLFETRRYPGWTNTAKVSARALFDIRQLLWRAKRYVREVGLEGLNFKKGQLSSINDDSLEETHAAGWIKSWQTSGPNVISITLTHVMPWGRSQQDVTQTDDVLALTDVLDQDIPMGIFYRDANGDEHLHQVSDVTDSNVATFVTPFLTAGSGLEVDLMVGAGKWGSVRRRVKVMAKVPKSMDKWVIELADEAPQLFLP